MLRATFVLALIPCFLPVSRLAQGNFTPTADPFGNQALVFERYDQTYRMHADGTGERVLHVVVRVQSDGAAQQFSVLAFPFASANETPRIEYVRVRKADGSTVETPAADAIDMPADVTREAPLYSDLKQKHIPVRSLAAGDTLEYEVDTEIARPEAPGQFWGTHHFTPPGSLVVLAETLTVEVPADKYVQVWSPNHKAEIAEKNGLRTYFWKVPQLIPAPKPTGDDTVKPETPKDPDEDEDGRKLPSVGWTTFRSWAEVGNWYRDLALAQSRPTDAVRERANSIAASAASPEEQVRTLYDHVSNHTRYVGIDFGVGRYKPHAAQEVMANQYGDCKDKDTLLEALLRAKGFTTAPALIGVGVAPVPDLPSPAVFNHVITTVNLPASRIWLDSTPPGAPFRYLVALIRGQKALIVPPDGPATLESTPDAAPYPLTVDFQATGSLDKDGKMTAKMRASFRDDEEFFVRELARKAAPADRDKVSQLVSGFSGFSGTTSNTAFENADDATRPMILTYDYAKHPFGDWDSLRIVSLFPAMEFPNLDSDSTEPKEDIDLGAPRTLTAISRIRLPEGFRTDLPDRVHVKTAFATFDKTYRFDGKEINVERTIAILRKKIPKADWKPYLAFTKSISLNNEPWIQLIQLPKPITLMTEKEATPTKITRNPDGTTTVELHAEKEAPAKKGVAPPADTASPAESAAELMGKLQDKLRSNDWSGARQILDQVKAKNPREAGLWAGYGFIAQASDHDKKLALEDYRKELEYHPDNAWVVGSLAQIQDQDGDSAGAQKTLQSFLEIHPDNVNFWLALGQVQTQGKDDAGALKTYETATKLNPDNRMLRVQLAETLLRLNRMDEAAAAAKSALDGSDDPGVLNNAAYTLSRTGRDLPLAVEASRKSIDKLEELSASLTADQANSRAFASSRLLVNSWDTLGWILFGLGRFDEARTWIAPAWHAGLSATIGSHLAQIDGKLGKKDEAHTTFKLSQSGIERSTSPEVRKEIEDGLARTGGDSKPSAGSGPVLTTRAASGHETLQDLRTWKVKRPAGASGWGAFRFVIDATGVVEARQMSGEDKLAAIQPTLRAMKFPELLPAISKARLLRSAVVSCSMGESCEVVFVPDGGLQTEMQ